VQKGHWLIGAVFGGGVLNDQPIYRGVLANEDRVAGQGAFMPMQIAEGQGTDRRIPLHPYEGIGLLHFFGMLKISLAHRQGLGGVDVIQGDAVIFPGGLAGVEFADTDTVLIVGAKDVGNVDILHPFPH